jgi:hypothetical protein
MQHLTPGGCVTLWFVVLCESSSCIRGNFNGFRTWGRKTFLGGVKPAYGSCCNEHDSIILPWKILVTYEARLTGKGVPNFHSTHFWREEKPHAAVTNQFQHRFAVNVWAGTNGNCVTGPYVPPPPHTHTNREQLPNFLGQTLPVSVEDVPLQTRQDMRFLHDGAPAHISCEFGDSPHSTCHRGGGQVPMVQSDGSTQFRFKSTGCLLLGTHEGARVP